MNASLDIVVRFSTSNPDLVIPIVKPSATTGLSLKRQIRAQLDAPASESRLRLIHAGKVLPDPAALSTSINVTRPPPTREDGSKSARAKGKQPDREIKTVASRVYIHCSIGDALTPAELAVEANEAQEADAALLSKPKTSTPTIREQDASASTSDSTTTPAPRGFDRLLSAGFTPAEVTTLRTQFLAIQSHTHTPDTMPTGPELLALEERWLDSGSNPSTAGGGSGGEDAGGFGDEDEGGLEDMLYGNLIGFFWPIGAMGWLMREEGVWSRRKQIAVLSGFLVNLLFGSLRLMV
ncbi:hypothetical protein LTR91_007371 [Friedmanniomyces endolithicus]|uniref:Ubiquitin-like domain-containing protein n=1 Tax=Friedmanniomyces endolithicus TaxID=329885 RepID=A0AAN6KQ86_9PEZI|nr:hypothetical protein LTR94_000367 [Friedmanniomyces endolithicus]KAK0814849.1 hypothetical protein LTR59_000604 [Friedmanniomyces endolithicus]KAK0820341.1 hypothetical protein LTR38_000250 [Friedmanniomyces endolithicus]KAK0840054.1 hypothetical protein LTR03_010846 [Friedmanniomyces endolithicus]KAK0861989.1 hypothetical protein LTS02_007480 [Friedmanniomyces endolithicus]